MTLRAVKPTTVKTRLKAMFYGEPGAGKTTAAIQFPKSYLIDTEKGAVHAQYTKLLEKNGGVIFQTTDYNEIITEVRALLSEPHEYKTLVIDSISTIYHNLVDEAEKRLGNEFGRHYGDANKKMKALRNLLICLDMNVIITAHSKDKCGEKMEVLEKIPDVDKKMAYIFDVLFFIKEVNGKRIAYLKKTRINTFKKTFEFSYDAIAEAYDRDILEKDATPVELASDDEVAQLTKLVVACNIPKTVSNKWLDKFDATTFDQMPADAINKCIDHLNSKIINSEVNQCQTQ